MYFYHAGSYFHHDASRFIIDQNYLSDLGRSLSFNGAQNPTYIFYTLTLSLAGIGVVLYYLLLSKTISNKWKYVVLLSATVSGVSYIGIALNPVNEALMPHLFFGKLSFLCFFIASIGMHILLDGKSHKKINKVLYVLNIMMFFYLLLMFFGPPSSTGIWALQLKTLAQKLVVYTLMLCAIIIVWDLKHQQDKIK
jgi:hypothetical membrane protein